MIIRTTTCEKMNSTSEDKKIKKSHRELPLRALSSSFS